MANLIAVEINDTDILVVAARTNAQRIQFSSIFSVELEPGDTDAVIASKLKTALGKQGAGRGETVVVVSRQQIELRDISVPPAPDNELPDLVRFQARNEFSSLNENWALDYVPFECQPGQQQRVLAGAISPQLMEQIKQVTEEAGLKPSKIVLRPYSTCELFKAELADDQCRMIIDPNEEQFDLTVTKGPDLMATRSVRTSGSYETEEAAQKLVGEIRRTIASTATTVNNAPLTEFLVVGSRDRLDHLSELLAENFEQDVTFLDPYTTAPGIADVAKQLPEHPERFASLIGTLIRESSGQRHPFDFANPRRPAIRKNNRSRALVLGGLAATLLIGMACLGWWVLGDQDAKISDLNQDLLDLKTTNEGNRTRPGVDQITGEVNLIDEWQKNNINWLDELLEISNRFETADDAIVDSMILSATEKGVGFNLNMRVNSIETGSTLKNNLTARPYLVRAGRTEEQRDDEDYPIKYDQFIELETDVQNTVDTTNTMARERLNAEPAPSDEDATQAPAGETETTDTSKTN